MAEVGSLGVVVWGFGVWRVSMTGCLRGLAVDGGQPSEEAGFGAAMAPSAGWW